MLLTLQVLVFTGCVLLGIFSDAEVYCSLAVPVAEVDPAPPPPSLPPRVRAAAETMDSGIVTLSGDHAAPDVISQR